MKYFQSNKYYLICVPISQISDAIILCPLGEQTFYKEFYILKIMSTMHLKFLWQKWVWSNGTHIREAGSHPFPSQFV